MTWVQRSKKNNLVGIIFVLGSFRLVQHSLFVVSSQDGSWSVKLATDRGQTNGCTCGPVNLYFLQEEPLRWEQELESAHPVVLITHRICIFYSKENLCLLLNYYVIIKQMSIMTIIMFIITTGFHINLVFWGADLMWNWIHSYEDLLNKIDTPKGYFFFQYRIFGKQKKAV